MRQWIEYPKVEGCSAGLRDHPTQAKVDKLARDPNANVYCLFIILFFLICDIYNKNMVILITNISAP